MPHLQAGTTLVIGASSGIAHALILKLLSSETRCRIIAVSRSLDYSFVSQWGERLHWFQSDYSESSIANICKQLIRDEKRIDRVFICNGLLHGANIFPEKRLQILDQKSFDEVFRVNAFLPMQWLKHLLPLLQKSQSCVVTVFSARVGSIADNNSGGWYSYRASKAALNMLLKTAAIECRRFSSNVKFLAFHPGTTDTGLSKPFQNGVPQGRLFRPEFVAERLLAIVESLPEEPVLNYLDWEGKAIEW